MKSENLPLVCIALFIFLFLAGCTSESSVDNSAKPENILSSSEQDLDGDGTPDVYSYSFSTTSADGVTVKRFLLASAEKELAGEGSIEDFSVAFEQFKTLRDEAELSCNQDLGLAGVRCLDAKTCSKLCSSNSQACKALIEKYGDTPSFFILQYIKDSTEVSKTSDSITSLLNKFDTLDETAKQTLLSKLVLIQSRIYSLNSNPLSNPDLFPLCITNDYGVSKIAKILIDSGVSSLNKNYYYTVAMQIQGKPSSANLAYEEVTIQDSLQFQTINGISSPHQLKTEQKNGKTLLSFPPFKQYEKESEIFVYTFSSELPPQEIASLLTKPAFSMKRVTFDFLAPASIIFGIAMNLGINYYIAVGLAFSVFIVILLVLLNLLHFLYNYIKSRSAGEPFQIVVKRTFGRTGVRWKTDLILAVVLLAIGFGASLSISQSYKNFDLYKIIDLIITDLSAFAAIVGSAIGFLMLYTAVENYAKILILEQVYGKKLREDKDLFQERVVQLKTRLAELKDLIDQLSKSNFDVSEEYDVASGVSVKHIDDLAKRNDHRSRDFVESELSKIEDAIDRLMERKKTADEGWQKWESEIEKLVAENEEVYVSNLITIPASLRAWALNHYASLHRESGIIFEGNMIKKKHITADKMARSLLDKELLKGLVVVKGGKLIMSQLLTGSGTMTGVLGAKLLSYLRTLTQKFKMQEYGSLAVVGDSTVLAVMKYRDIESVIFIPKEKFKEAIDDWKEKIKTL